MKCQLCNSSKTAMILDLGEQPICNAVLTAEELKQHEPKYPLKVYVCTDCFLMQIENKVPYTEVFGCKYNYLTGSTASLKQYFHKLANEVVARFSLTRNDLVIDVGCNDGTLLEYFRENDVQVLGVEPTPLPAQAARDKGITIHQAFFEQLNRQHFSFTIIQGDTRISFPDKAKVITAMNVIAHTKDIHGFLEKVKENLTSDGVFISQSHYLPALIENLEYDTIYHEHLRYYTLTTLKHLFEMHGLYIFDATTNDVYGGSIVVYAGLKKTNQKLPLYDAEAKYREIETYWKFADQVQANSSKLFNYLVKLKKQGKRIIGIGAPMKASTLLNYCQITPGILDVLTELNPLKIGHYSPGTHIPIVFETKETVASADYALILSWNVSDRIISTYREFGYKGGFIIPIPRFHVLNEITKVEDERGVITDVLTDEEIEHVNHITFKKGAVRGNHYHKESLHYDYVLKGKLVFHNKLPWETVKQTVALPGDLIFTGPNERHAVEALEDSEMMVFTRGPRGGRNYESDTYRLEGDDKLV